MECAQGASPHWQPSVVLTHPWGPSVHDEYLHVTQKPLLGCTLLAVITDSSMSTARNWEMLTMFFLKKKSTQRLQTLIKEKLCRAIWKEHCSELQIPCQISAAFYGFGGVFQQCYYVRFYEFLPSRWTGILIEGNACCLPRCTLSPEHASFKSVPLCFDYFSSYISGSES